MKGIKLLSAIIAGAMVLGTMSFPVFAANETYTVDAENTLESVMSVINTSASGDVVINLDTDVTLKLPGYYDDLVNDNITSLTINGNNHNLQVDATYRLKFNMDGILKLNDVTVSSDYYEAGTWDSWDFLFNCSVDFTDVTFTRAIALEKDAKLTGVTVNEDNDYYAIWIPANGYDVTMDNVTVNSGRGIAIKDQYVNAPQKVDLTVENSTFNTTGSKAAVLVTSQAGATIVANNNDISNVAADSSSLVWVDEDKKASYSEVNVTVNNETVAPVLEGAAENNYVAIVGDIACTTLQYAVTEALTDGKVILLSDTAGNGIQIPSGSNVTIDFNGFTYNIDGTTVGSSGTTTNGFQLFKGSNITFKNGTITSNKAQILIQNYSNLTLENMTLDGSKLRGRSPYTLSNNCGNTVLKGNTNIIAKEGDVAFDCYYWPSNGYTEGVTVTLGEDFTGKIDGAIEKTHDNSVTDEDAASKQSISISGGTFTTDVSDFCTDGFSPKLVNGVYVVDNAAGVITVNFKQRDDDKNSYDIVLKGDGEGIYEFVSAELQFENNSNNLSGEPMNYEITGTDAVNVIANTANTDRYGFYLKDGAVSSRLSGAEVTIGKLTFPAQGNRDFKVTAAESTVITTLKGTHLETTYTATGVSKLVAGNPINDEVAAATRDVAINVDFAHKLDNTGWNGNHQITVTLKDAFGNIVGDNAYPLAIANNAGTYTFADVPVGRITVTLKAPGFRTFTYTTTVEEGTDPLVLSFWNDTKRDAEKAVEIGGRTMNNNFVVGDIAMDYIVDKYDLAAVTSYYGTYNLTDENKIRYDLNRDGSIDITDVAYVLHNFGF